MTQILRTTVPSSDRSKIAASLFGIDFPMVIEPFIYNITSSLTDDYSGGYWEFHTLSNQGFYMALDESKNYTLSCQNGFEGTLSGDALGIVVCLYAYSNLSFSDREKFAQTCARHYRWLRDYAAEHPEVAVIFKAID